MAREEHDPLKELLRFVLIAGGMAVFVLVLSRGKWLMAALLGLWLLGVFFRFKRAARRD
jgi:type IV secretory pathway TrbD component